MDGTYFENSQVVVCDVAPNIEDWMTEMVLEMTVYNITDQPVNVLIKKEEVQLVEGTSNSFCWGNCFAPSVMVSPYPIEIGAHAASLDGELSFHYNLDPEGNSYGADGIDVSLWPSGTSIIRYYAYSEDNLDDKVCIEVWFAYNATSVVENHVSFGQALPNPASTTVHFSIGNSGDVVINAELYNLLGQEVKRQTTNGQQNKIEFNVSDLQPGIYFCRFSINGEMVKTEKFIVKR